MSAPSGPRYVTCLGVGINRKEIGKQGRMRKQGLPDRGTSAATIASTCPHVSSLTGPRSPFLFQRPHRFSMPSAPCYSKTCCPSATHGTMPHPRSTGVSNLVPAFKTTSDWIGTRRPDPQGWRPLKNPTENPAGRLADAYRTNLSLLKNQPTTCFCMAIVCPHISTSSRHKLWYLLTSTRCQVQRRP